MANKEILPFGPGASMPIGYPIADNLNSNRADWALSAKQGKVLKEMVGAGQPKMPELLIMGEKTEVIYTIDDFLFAQEYDPGNNIDNLKFSTDLGETWITITNTYGTIVNAFMFADGTFMMGCKKADGCRIYWTRDFSTFTEATIYDLNSSGEYVSYTPVSGTTRFFILEPRAKHVYVDGVEHYCFWDYIITTTNPRLWYALSEENGVVVRAAFAFGLTEIGGVTLMARHVHGFDYNPYNGYFYAFTGDANSECHVLKGQPDANHAWTWELLATGGGYKLTTIRYDEGNLYALTDYTDASLNGDKGIVSIPIDKLGLSRTNSSNVVCPAVMRYWLHATAEFMADGSINPSSPAALTGGDVVDNHGWRLVPTDYLGNSKHLIATGGHNYVWVDNDLGLKFGSFIGPNNQGDMIITASSPGTSVSGEGWLKMSHKDHYNLTEIMRRSGATDFFKDYVGTIY